MKLDLPHVVVCVAVFSAGLYPPRIRADGSAALASQQATNSYAIGVDLARNLKRTGVSLDTEPFMNGIRDALSGQKLGMSEEDLRETLRVLQLEQRRKQILARGGTLGVALQNAEKGAAFLAQNKTNAGVVTLPSGLQYKVLKTGDGPKPGETDTITCHFRGTLIDGRDFSGDDPAGKPSTFKMSEVIPGWKEALQLMPVGSKWQLFIPPQLAFGDGGVGRARLAPKIGPNETVIYELELLGID